MEKQWFVVNTYSGHESKVKEKLEQRTVSMGMTENICCYIILFNLSIIFYRNRCFSIIHKGAVLIWKNNGM